MLQYETTVIVQPEISDEGVQEICTRMNALLGKHEAQRLGLDDQGKRKLAYEIRKFQKGHYLTLMYLDEGKVVPEIERALRLDDSVLRFLTVLVKEQVPDIEARKAEAAELEQERARKAAERAVREAEDAAREAEEAAKATEEAARRATEEAAKVTEEAAKAAESGAEAPKESDSEAPEATTEGEAGAEDEGKEG